MKYSGITIGLEGERHLGAVVGNSDFKKKYVQNKIEKWIQDINQLSEIAVNEPQLALCAYTKAMCMRWSFVQRTISNISQLFQPLEEVIRDTFIPAVIGRKVSDVERRMLALPVRFGGIGILNPTETADMAFDISVRITSELKGIIYNQEANLDNLNDESLINGCYLEPN